MQPKMTYRHTVALSAFSWDPKAVDMIPSDPLFLLPAGHDPSVPHTTTYLDDMTPSPAKRLMDGFGL